MLLWIPCSPSPLHFCSILGAKGSQRPWAQRRPIGYLPFIPWPRLLSEAWNSCSTGGAGGASRALRASYSWGYRVWERAGPLHRQGGQLSLVTISPAMDLGGSHGPPAQIAVDCLIL